MQLTNAGEGVDARKYKLRTLTQTKQMLQDVIEKHRGLERVNALPKINLSLLYTLPNVNYSPPILYIG